ncbi:hypothetical protein NDU88_005623 [Pleurodeles waltl]|uniref:histone acetyltransferase n=1 Tax=Pleurodeles waltl TaxID=8319 RepID=A0AAV7UJH5_PLEWA|nr:hypothetical protein NDU88_005623 [Pleurodeles waltl]
METREGMGGGAGLWAESSNGEDGGGALAEILSVKDISGKKLFYVHYIDFNFNKRLDEWVTHDRLDLKKIQFPKKEVNTPTKNGLSGSRPNSPEREVRKNLDLSLQPAQFHQVAKPFPSRSGKWKRKVEVVSPATPVLAPPETAPASIFPQNGSARRPVVVAAQPGRKRKANCLGADEDTGLPARSTAVVGCLLKTRWEDYNTQNPLGFLCAKWRESAVTPPGPLNCN